MTSFLIYDCEIAKAIQGRNEVRLPDVEYCDGWQDYKGMGISCVGAYSSLTDRYHLFGPGNFWELESTFLSHNLLVGFNNINFDNKLLIANELLPEHMEIMGNYDILREIWIAAGLGVKFVPATHGGYGLDPTFQTNFPYSGYGKNGNGAYAPVLFQQGKWAQLSDYCLNDIKMTKDIFLKILKTGELICPKTGEILQLRQPFCDSVHYSHPNTDG